MVDHLYKEPEDNLVMRSFVFDNIDAEESEQEKNNPEMKKRKDEKKSGNKSVKSGDIRYFFQKCRNDEINKTSEKRKGCSRSRLIIKNIKKKCIVYFMFNVFYLRKRHTSIS